VAPLDYQSPWPTLKTEAATPQPESQKLAYRSPVKLCGRGSRRASGQPCSGRSYRVPEDFTGGWEDGRYARREFLGFEWRGDARRLRSFRAAHRGSNHKNLADLPSSRPPVNLGGSRHARSR